MDKSRNISDGKMSTEFRNQLKLEPSGRRISQEKYRKRSANLTISDVEMLSSDGGRIHLVGGGGETRHR